MQYYPHRENKHGLIAFLMLFVLSLLCFLLSSALPRYPALPQLIGLGCAVAALLLSERFLMTNYLYVLTPTDLLHRTNCLTVIRVLGRKRRTVAKLSLTHAVALLPAERAGAYLKEHDLHPRERLSVCVDLFPAVSYALVLQDREDVTVLILQCDRYFRDEIASRICPTGDAV